jgi:hypothetical protein
MQSVGVSGYGSWTYTLSENSTLRILGNSALKNYLNVREEIISG